MYFRQNKEGAFIASIITGILVAFHQYDYASATALISIIYALPDSPKEWFSVLSLLKLVVYYGLFLIPKLLFYLFNLGQKFF